MALLFDRGAEASGVRNSVGSHKNDRRRAFRVRSKLAEFINAGGRRPLEMPHHHRPSKAVPERRVCGR